MMRKHLIVTAALLLAFGLSASAQYFESEIAPPPDTTAKVFEQMYVDTLTIKVPALNNYSSVGFSFGLTSTAMSFNPTHGQHRDEYFGYDSLRFTHYEKMFDYLPYFGWQIGVEYGHEGYHFKKNDETDYTFVFYKERSEQIKMQVVEVPFLAMIHYDTRWAKFFADFGLYAGYRLSIERFGPLVEEAYRYDWYDSDRRWDYGLQGGAGAGFFLDPFEFFFRVELRYGWSSIFEPDSQFPEGSGYEDRNAYYWRFGYPFDMMYSVGVNINLGKRYGKTKKDLKREAYDIVYGTKENSNQ